MGRETMTPVTRVEEASRMSSCLWSGKRVDEITTPCERACRGGVGSAADLEPPTRPQILFQPL